MRGIMESDDWFLVLTTTPVDLQATGSTADSQEDVLLVRFYLNVWQQSKQPPSGKFNLAGIDKTSADPALIGNVAKFQSKNGCVVDGRVSVPRNDTLKTGSGKFYTIRQMASYWNIYKVAHQQPDSFKIWQHPLCPPRLKGALLIKGING